ncbi:MAG: hypothetical protein ABFC96_07025 [Thermoguttaceae bacterium]
MNAIREILLVLFGVVLVLLTMSLFAAGFSDHNPGGLIAGAILLGCTMIALAINNHRRCGE